MTNTKKHQGSNGNTIADTVMQVASAIGVLALAYWKVLEYIPTHDNSIRYVLPVLPIGILVYLMVSPLFRK